MKTYEPYQLTRSTASPVSLSAVSFASAVRDAVLPVVGHKRRLSSVMGASQSPTKTPIFAKRILSVLDAAPATANEAPAHLKHICTTVDAKNDAGNRVGNGYKGFDAVLEKLVVEVQ